MQQTGDIQHDWTCSTNGRTILKQTLKKYGVKVQNGDNWLKLEVLWSALQNTAMNLYIPQYTTGLSVTSMQHYHATLQECQQHTDRTSSKWMQFLCGKSYHIQKTIRQLTAGGQSLCGKSYHIHKTIQQLTAGGCNGNLYDCYAQYTEKVMKSNKHTYATKLTTACFLSNMFHHFIRSPTRKNV